MSTKKKSKTSKKNDPQIHFMADPFFLPHLEVMDAQANTEALILEEAFDGEPFTLNPESEIDQRIQRLTEVMADENQKQIEELEKAAENWAPEEASAEIELARQIEEDLALEREDQEALNEATGEEAALETLPIAHLEPAEIQAQIETLLFLSDRPLPQKRIQEMLPESVPSADLESSLIEIQARYGAGFHGFELVEVGGGFQFRTKTHLSAVARKLVKVQPQRLSRGAMETLAIVAYKQPVLKDDVDKIRGVDSSHFIRGLLEKHLLAISGRSELPGRPMVYSTTQEFLELFGLKDLSALPPLHEIEKMIPTSEAGSPSDENNPQLIEMRRMMQKISADKDRIDYDPREDERILKEIRERIKSIPVTTRTLVEQDNPPEPEAAPPEAATEPDIINEV